MSISIEDILSVVNLTPEIAETVALAVANPTSANVNAVVKAYAANGQVVPARLYAYLIQQNEEKYPQDTVRGAAFPYFLLGAGVLAFALLRGKKR